MLLALASPFARAVGFLAYKAIKRFLPSKHCNILYTTSPFELFGSWYCHIDLTGPRCGSRTNGAPKLKALAEAGYRGTRTVVRIEEKKTQKADGGQLRHFIDTPEFVLRGFVLPAEGGRRRRAEGGRQRAA